jgi:hypothetical protein
LSSITTYQRNRRFKKVIQLLWSISWNGLLSMNFFILEHSTQKLIQRQPNL